VSEGTNTNMPATNALV